MQQNKPTSGNFLFWQTALSVILGLAASTAVLLYLHNGQIAEVPENAGGTVAGKRAFGPFFPKLSLFPHLKRRTNILVLGVDSNGTGTRRFVGTRSDAIMFVSLDPIGKKVGVISIPRDSRVSIPGHGKGKINSAHALGGAELAAETVEEAFDVPVDHYVVVDSEGFKKFVNTVGPVKVLVEKRMRYADRSQKLSVDLEPGLQELDGGKTEEYIRFRHDAKGDIGRIERQQWFTRQLAGKLKDPQIVFKLPELFALANENVLTDLSVNDMAAITDFLRKLSPTQIKTATLPGQGVMIDGGSYWLPDEKASQIVFDRLAGTYLTYEKFVDRYFAEQEQSRIRRRNRDRRIRVSLKYPRGAGELVERLAARLEENGYRIGYKWAVKSAECQHEQIVQVSKRATDDVTEKLKESFPELSEFPVVVSLESRPVTDITLVLSPESPLIAQVDDGEPDSELIDEAMTY